MEENGFKRPEIIENIAPDRITLTLQIEIDGNLDGNDGNPDGNEGNPDGNLTPNEQLVLAEIAKETSNTFIKSGSFVKPKESTKCALFSPSSCSTTMSLTERECPL